MITSEQVARRLYAELVLVVGEIEDEEWRRIMGVINSGGGLDRLEDMQRQSDALIDAYTLNTNMHEHTCDECLTNGHTGRTALALSSAE